MNNKNFWQSLKKFMLTTSKEHNLNIMDYYITLQQHESEIQFIIDDYNKFNFCFQFQYDKSQNSPPIGSITIYLQKPNHEEMMWTESFLNYVYKIDLCYDERYWSCCQCDPKMKEYNPIHKCCGLGCEWNAPSINIDKIECLTNFTFKGYQKDLWELQTEFKNSLTALELTQKQERLNRVIEQINALEEQRKQLLNELDTL